MSTTSQSKKLYKTILAAVFAALTCVATMVIQIPSPMNGYVNLGDCIVIISGWLLGPVYGFFSAGIGSMLADLFAGYPHYAVGTFFIKGIVALCAAVIPLISKKNTPSVKFVLRMTGGVIGETLMVLGYFGYASLLLGKGLAAAAGIPGNIVQGAIGIVSAIAVYELLVRVGAVEKCRVLQ